MDDSEFIVLEKYSTGDVLNNSDLWGLIGHKAPNYYHHHSVGDNAIDKLLDYKFISLFWSDNNGNNQYIITDQGKDVYAAEKFKREELAKKSELDKLLIETTIASNRSATSVNKFFWASIVLAAVSTAATVKSCQISNQQHNEYIEEKSKDSTIKQQKTQLSQRTDALSAAQNERDSLLRILNDTSHKTNPTLK